MKVLLTEGTFELDVNVESNRVYLERGKRQRKVKVLARLKGGEYVGLAVFLESMELMGTEQECMYRLCSMMR
jgi:hypothetical protein